MFFLRFSRFEFSRNNKIDKLFEKSPLVCQIKLFLFRLNLVF